MKLKDFLPRIPRPVKACFFAILVVSLAIVYYIVLGCPPLTFRQQFRRAEKANMVGPSTIVDTTGRGYTDFEKMLVGETEYGICFYGRYGSSYSAGIHSGKRNYHFSYVEKTGDLTVAAAPNAYAVHWSIGGINPKASLPVYVFSNSPDAARAEIEVSVRKQYGTTDSDNANADYYTETFSGEAIRSKTGMFRISLQAEGKQAVDALWYLSDIASGSSLFQKQLDTTILATVRLYDDSGILIQEKELDLSPKNQ